MKGLFCVDPGVHTGVAWAVVDIDKDTAAEAMRQRQYTRSSTLEGDPVDQAQQLFGEWWRFTCTCLAAGLGPDDIELIMEDFVLRAGPHAGGKDGTAPERIAWAFEGYRAGRHDTHRKLKSLHPTIWQQPGAAATFKSRPRLTKAGCWIVGAEHERSAFSHMMLRVNTLMDQNTRRR
jgi:hypothetical protein